MTSLENLVNLTARLRRQAGTLRTQAALLEEMADQLDASLPDVLSEANAERYADLQRCHASAVSQRERAAVAAIGTAEDECER